MNRLEKTLAFLEDDDVPFQGLATDAEGFALAERLAPGQPFCLVARWTIADLIVSDEEKALIEAQGCSPQMLYAEKVLFDSAGRLSPGDFVRTSFLVELREDVLFQTLNTAYILIGQGHRKPVDPLAIMGIF